MTMTARDFCREQAKETLALLPKGLRQHWTVYVASGNSHNLCWDWELRCGPLSLYRWEDDGSVLYRCTCAGRITPGQRRQRFDWERPTGVHDTPTGAVRREVAAVMAYFLDGRALDGVGAFGTFGTFFRSVGLWPLDRSTTKEGR